MNNQEALNQVWQWFIVERHAPGKSYLNTCVYYDVRSGTKCAIGCLLPQEILDSIENRSICTLMDRNEVVARFFHDTSPGFLGLLQFSHDTATGNPDFYGRLEDLLRSIVGQYELTVPETEEQMIVEKLLEEVSEPVLA